MNKYQSLNVKMIFFVLNIMLTSVVVTGACFIVLQIIFPLTAPIFSPIIILLVSGSIGTSISVVASEKFLKPINELIQATKIVSTGDFSVRLEELAEESELAELTRNFNDMVKELGSIELFRNDFINNFSHEFKTPIVSIRGFAKQLQNEDLPIEKRKEYTHIIITESERLSKMTKNVLLLSKFENQQFITDQVEYDVDEQIRHSIILLEKKWSIKNININLNLHAIKIYSNQEMLSHLWINLIDNAIKYTNEDGNIEMILYQTNNDIVFKISDDGNGMDEQMIKRIFDKFYQVDSSHAAQGYGLGLSIAKRIVELSRGSISVESRIGEGTTFTVRFPIGFKVRESTFPELPA
jgi:signal transduction histidine kinase